MSNIAIGGAIYSQNAPIINKLTTFKQRQEEASAELAKAGFSAADPKIQALIEELNAQIRALQKQLSIIMQNIRQVMATKDEGLEISAGEMLNANIANENAQKMSQNLGSLLSGAAASKADGVDGNAMENSNIAVSFDTASFELAGLVSLDPSKMPEGSTKDEKLLKLNALKTAIEEQISALSAKIASLMSSGFDILA